MDSITGSRKELRVQRSAPHLEKCKRNLVEQDHQTRSPILPDWMIEPLHSGGPWGLRL